MAASCGLHRDGSASPVGARRRPRSLFAIIFQSPADVGYGERGQGGVEFGS